MSKKRPSLARGLTFPIYTSPSESLVDSTISSLASLNIHTEDPRSSTAPRAGLSSSYSTSGISINLFSLAPAAATDSPSPSQLPQQQQQQERRDTSHPAPLDSPPKLPMSQSTTPQSPHHHHHHSSSSYFPPYPSSSSSSSSPRYRIPSASSSPAVSPGIPLTTGRSSSTSYVPSTTLPMITSPPNINAAFRGQSDYRNRSNVAMTIDSTPSHYILMAPLGDGFSADSITVAARKENILVIIADRWDQEQDCHNEWQVQFGRDSDMSNIHANFDNGLLKITVKRFTNHHP